MALPTVVKTWQRTLCNQQLSQGSTSADNKLLFLNLLNSLLGFASNPWVVDYSCNGTTAGTVGDGVNRITSVANVVMGTNSAAHSWVVLKQSGINSGFRLLLSCGVSGYSASTMNIFIGVSWNAGYTGGSTTADPTATDSTTIAAYSSSGLKWVWNNSVASSSTLSYRYSVMQSTDGAATTVIITTGAGSQFHLVICVPQNPVSGWTNPCVVMVSTGYSPTAMTGFMRANSINGTVQFGSVGVYTGAIPGSGMLVLLDSGSVANEIDSNWPILDAHIICPTTGIRGDHGTLTDVWYGSSSVATADSYNAAGSLEFVQFGNAIYSWDGATTVTLS